MKNLAAPLLHWAPGPVLALAGVVGVRWIAPVLAGRMQATVVIAGYLLVPVGLAWFASRLGQRAARRAAGSPEPRIQP